MHGIGGRPLKNPQKNAYVIPNKINQLNNYILNLLIKFFFQNFDFLDFLLSGRPRGPRKILIKMSNL